MQARRRDPGRRGRVSCERASQQPHDLGDDTADEERHSHAAQPSSDREGLAALLHADEHGTGAGYEESERHQCDEDLSALEAEIVQLGGTEIASHAAHRARVGGGRGELEPADDERRQQSLQSPECIRHLENTEQQCACDEIEADSTTLPSPMPKRTHRACALSWADLRTRIGPARLRRRSVEGTIHVASTWRPALAGAAAGAISLRGARRPCGAEV